MNSHRFSWNRFESVPIIGIVRGIPLVQIRKFIPAYISAGLATIEIAMNSPDAKGAIQFLTDDYSKELNIGAGTVCNDHDLDNALESGAQFIVSPIVSKSVIRRCSDLEIPVFPGAFTPTEIYEAWELGASMVKVYPAGVLGPSYIKDLKAPLNQIKLLPTGGINAENMMVFMKAGASGVGLGSSLFNKHLIEQENWEALGKHFAQFAKQFVDRD